MAYTVVQSCPLIVQEWSNRASSTCSNEENYHCVEDEYSRTVEACAEPIWIEPGILLGLSIANKIFTFLIVIYNHKKVLDIRDSLKVTGEEIVRKTGCVVRFTPDKAHYNKCLNICIANLTGEVSI